MKTISRPIVKTIIRCGYCRNRSKTKKTAAGEARLPTGWKRFDGRVMCKGCVREKFQLRGPAIPVSGPVGATWEEFREALKSAWAQSTALANWAVLELAKADPPRTPGQEKQGPIPELDLYRLAKQHYPDWAAWYGATKAASCLLQAVKKKYLKRRWHIWACRESIPTYRYPVPYPMHNQGWVARFDGEVPVVDVALGGRKFTLRLRGGPDFRRQLADFRHVAEGRAIRGELSVYRQRGQRSSHRTGLESRQPGGGENIHYVVMLKFAGWLPRRARKTGSETLVVKTYPDALWAADLRERRAWVYNADDVRRRVSAHESYLQRMSEDQKYETRDRRGRLRRNESREKRCLKQRRFLESRCHEASAAMLNFAVRNGVGKVVYDDANKTYLPRFPWHRLRELLHYKMEGAGIVFLCTKDQEGGE